MRLHSRTTLGRSGHRPLNWPTASDPARHTRAEGELTLGLDEEWEDVPTAHLDAASYSEATADVEPPPAEPAPAGRELPLADVTARAAAVTPAPAASAQATERPRPSAEPVKPASPVRPAEFPAQAPATAEPSRPIPRDITTGTLLCNRYVLGRLLGTGGSSLIFQAEDRRRIGAEDFGNRIAIKVLRPDMRNNAHALTRLRREFRQMQRLEHPGIAKVYELAHDEDVWFMTMELIEGLTINQWLKASTNRAAGLKVISACCEALHYAHETGVVHGDLKPSNVLVLAEGAVKVVDFGSAAERDASMGVIDKERSFAATPPFASPQVLAGEVAEPRDDVFSLACLAYAVLTQGEHPFERKSSAEAQHAQMRPAYARGILPRQFDVLVRALAWDREQRPANVREFMHALLASDLRRDVSERDTVPATVGVGSKPVPPPVAPSVQTQGAATAIAAPAAPIAREPRTADSPKPTTDVKPEDIARLKAAVAAAEVQAARIKEAPATEQDQKPRKGDPLERFKGYVTDPLAHQSDERRDVPDSLADEAAHEASRRKWVWPWQRSALFGLLLALGGAAAIVARVDPDAEPIQQAAARVAHSSLPSTAPVAEPPAAPAEMQPMPTAPQAEEKKSPAVAPKPKSVPAVVPSEVSFTTRTLQIGANQTVAALAVKRLNSTRGRARVAWTIEDGTARRGVHYDIANPQLIEFLDGQSVRSLFIPLMPDKEAEGARHSKTFTVKLQRANGGPALGEIKQVYVTIVGDVSEAVASTGS